MKLSGFSWMQNIGVFFAGMIVAFFVVHQTYTSQTASISDVFVSKDHETVFHTDMIRDQSDETRGLLLFDQFSPYDIDDTILIVEFVLGDVVVDYDAIYSPYPYSYIYNDGVLQLMFEWQSNLVAKEKIILQWDGIPQEIVLSQISIFDAETTYPLRIQTLSSSQGYHQ